LRITYISFAREFGGGEQYLFDLVSRLHALKVSVSVRAASDELVRKLRGAGVSCSPLGSGPGIVLTARKAVREALREGGRNIIHYNEPRSMYFRPDLGEAPAVVTVHCSLSLLRGTRRFLRDVLLKWAARGMARLVCVSEAVRKELQDLDPSLPVTTIEGGVDTDRFKATPYPTGGPRKVLQVSRIYTGKGQGDVLRAVAGIPGVEVSFAGTGPDREMRRLEREAGRLHVPCRLLGFVDGPASLYASASIVLLPSKSEGLGLTVLEAMAAARPVVVYDFPAVRTLIQDGKEGRIVPMGDVEALGRAIREILDDPTRAGEMGRAGRETAQSRFSLDRSVRRMRSLYSEIASEPGNNDRHDDAGESSPPRLGPPPQG